MNVPKWRGERRTQADFNAALHLFRLSPDCHAAEKLRDEGGVEKQQLK